MNVVDCDDVVVVAAFVGDDAAFADDGAIVVVSRAYGAAK